MSKGSGEAICNVQDTPSGVWLLVSILFYKQDAPPERQLHYFIDNILTRGEESYNVG